MRHQRVDKPEHCPHCLRAIAFRVEDALGKKLKGINIDRPQALTMMRAMFDLADKLELELPNAGPE